MVNGFSHAFPSSDWKFQSWREEWTSGAPTPSSAFDNQVEYQYSATEGRLATVRRGDIPVPQEFNYTYTQNSSLIATVTSPVHTVTNSYDGTRNVLFTKTNHTGNPANPLSKFDYSLGSGVNDLGQRTSLATTGSGFDGATLTNTTATGPAYGWGYNNRGELVSANDTSAANNDRAYAFDGIGNRQSGGALGSPVSYTANALNQYTAINSLTPSYDEDGNLTSGPLPANVNANSTLIWDGENRLIQAQVNGGNTVNYKYDAQSRKIAETVGSATTVYIYDGWNPIAEYWRAGLQPAALSKTYTWGVDLSGSMQGAGGVGGLLAVTDSTGTHYPTYDGNGNVSEYLDSNGNTVAHYEYDPFGKTTVATGPKAADFSHRFSTKPLDVTTGLYYYGYRYYDPETGRWPSRDPIEEMGGYNLYGFVGNAGVNKLDYLGLVLYVIFYYVDKESDPDESFKKAAETAAKKIKLRGNYDSTCDEVKLIPVNTADEFKKAWADLAKENQVDDRDKWIDELYLMTHAGKGDDGNTPQIHLKDSNLNENDIETLARLNFIEGGDIYCRGCRSGLPGYGGEDPVAKNFTDRQKVTSWGETGYATFSESPDAKQLWDRLTKDTVDVFLNSYGEGEKGAGGYGSIRRKKEFKPESD